MPFQRSCSLKQQKKCHALFILPKRVPEWPKRCTLKKTIDAVHHLVTLVNTLYLRRSISPDFTKLISLQEFILELFGVIGALAKGSVVVWS